METSDVLDKSASLTAPPTTVMRGVSISGFKSFSPWRRTVVFAMSTA